MFSNLCSILCNTTDEMRDIKEEISPKYLVGYSKNDIEDFAHYIQENHDSSFLQVFFYYKKIAPTREVSLSNLYFKIVLLEHFMACSMFLNEIFSLSHNGVRGYLIVDQKLTEDEKEELSRLLMYCQKRASIMLNVKVFKYYMHKDPMMPDGPLDKKFSTVTKLLRLMKDFQKHYFAFKKGTEATSRIVDYRFTFFNTFVNASFCYIIILCSHIDTMNEHQIYELLSSLLLLEELVTFMNTNVSLLLSEEVSTKIIEFPPLLISSVQTIYYKDCKSGSKTECLTEAYNNILDIGLDMINRHKILKDVNHFRRFQKFIMQQPTASNLSIENSQVSPERIIVGSSTGGSSEIKYGKAQKSKTKTRGSKAKSKRFKIKESNLESSEEIEDSEDYVMEDELDKILNEAEESEDSDSRMLSTIYEAGDSTDNASKSGNRFPPPHSSDQLQLHIAMTSQRGFPN